MDLPREDPNPAPPLEPNLPADPRLDSAAFRVGRAFPRALLRALGGGAIGAGLSMGLATTGWFPSRPPNRVMFLDGLGIGLCFGLAALVEAVGWGAAARPSRARIGLTAFAVWIVAVGVIWASALEIAYFDGLVLEGLEREELQGALAEYIEAVRDDTLPHLVVYAMLGLPFAALSLGDGCRLGRAELAGMATLAAAIPALPVCFGNPMFEGGVNPDSGLQFLLVAGFAACLPVVGKLSDLREGRAPSPRPDRKLAWLTTLALALTTPGIWAATRVQGDTRLNYYLLSALRLENARDAVDAGDYERAIAVCRQAEEQGTALFARDELRYCWIEAAWVLGTDGPSDLSEGEREWLSVFPDDRRCRGQRAAVRLARGDYAGALEDLDVARAMPENGEPPTYAELWLLRAEAHARLGDPAAAQHDLQKAEAAALPAANSAVERVRALLTKPEASPQPGYGSEPGAW